MSKRERNHPERIHLHENRTPLSRVTFSWTEPFISKARKDVLSTEDISETPSWVETQKSRERFLYFWELGKKEGRGWIWIMARMFKRDFLKNAFFSFSADIILYIQPFIIERMLKGLDQGLPRENLLVYASILVIMMMVRMVMVNYCNSKVFDMGYVARAAIMGAIYQKSLSFASGPRRKFCSGKGINILTSDTNKIANLFGYINFTWILPFRIILTFVFGYIYMGVYAFPAIGFIMIVIPSLYLMARKLKSLRNRLAVAIDARMGLTQEALGNIRVVKYLALEGFCRSKIDAERSTELLLLFSINAITAVAGAIDFWAPIFAANLSIASAALYGQKLVPGKVFAFLQIFSQLTVPLWVLPNFVAGFISCKIATKRIDAMLGADCCPESLSDGSLAGSDISIKVDHASFQWDSLPPDPKIIKKRKRGLHPDCTIVSESLRDLFAFRDVNLQIPAGSLVAVIGKSGCGKSSLISALMGEMRIKQGNRQVHGSVGLCPQNVWLINGTVRENILFGLPFVEKHYQAVLKQCTIDQDISEFPNGDQTMIGEKGTTVSGGQRQRIGLARVAYAAPEVAFLDDPLSAVDANVGRALFYNCIKNGAMKKSTRILTTHHTGFLSDCDLIVVMGEAKIVAVGSYNELLGSCNPEHAYVQHLLSRSPLPHASSTDIKPPSASEIEVIDSTCSISIRSEIKYQESVSRRATRNSMTVYFKAFGGLLPAIALLALALATEVFKVAREHFLREAMPEDPSITLSGTKSIRISLLYALFGTLQGLCSCTVSVLAVYLCMKASKSLHEECIDRVLSAKPSVFDETPIGRILNRFGRDLDSIDTNFPDRITQFMVCISALVSSIILLGVYEPRFLPTLAIPIAATLWLQQRFRRAWRQLQQLTGITLGPIVSHFSESMSGLPTIRAFNQERSFTTIYDKFNDQYCYAAVWLMSVRRWASLRSEALWILYLYALLVICIAIGLKSQMVGLIFTYIFHNIESVDWSMRQMAELESCVVSVERLHQYVMAMDAEVDDPEKPEIMTNKVELIKSQSILESLEKAPFEWPSEGLVEFNSVTVRYKPSLPPVISNFNFTFKPRTKVAIVGRSGAGKSTIITALFRFNELAGGQILIDGVDIGAISFKKLRQALAMVPQDPVLFSGSLRSNLDPQGIHNDEKLWSALESIKMRSAIQEHPAKLDLLIDDSSSGFSIGQRQLLCMARAILRGAKIIVMDEATSNLDRETEALMQESLNETFSSSTIITIAHRLETILNHDTVIVMGRGKVLESGSPAELFERGGEFSKMLKAAGVDVSQLKRP